MRLKPPYAAHNWSCEPTCLLKHVLLDADRLAREIALRNHFAVESVQRMQQPDGERAARSQSGPRRQVGIVMDFESLGDPLVRQNSAHGGMLDVRDLVDQFDLRIDDSGLVLEERRQSAYADVAILVDRSADDTSRRARGTTMDSRFRRRTAKYGMGCG